ncbi:hypothetical protein NE237_028877 [Protea cynaroides]|uniref:Protein kinase domain-containing protein n=1 Tax=Protea cynaroides TaxID=273540 RepID=A0A9Q0GT88_9MAGN|nr:hypothetical protein NE237_028877 [Protea cynaroides]
MEKKRYPTGSEHYVLYEEIGQGVSASVCRALCIPFNEIVAIKILDFEKHDTDLSKISREVQTMSLVEHPNVLKAHCCFVNGHYLWVVMPFMAGGSFLHILKAAYPNGLEEVVIATILHEVLKGLDYLHQQGHLHRDVKAGNILVDAHGAIKLGDFGVSASVFDSGDKQRMRNTFVGTPCWMAPEVVGQLHGYDFKADIWSFGITALELAHGHAPFSKYPPMKVFLMTLQNAPPGLDRERKFSKSFKRMVANCLVKNPSNRPAAKNLIKHSFFRQARSNDYIARTIIKGLPSLGNVIKELKMKEANMLAPKKISDGQEEISQVEEKKVHSQISWLPKFWGSSVRRDFDGDSGSSSLSFAFSASMEVQFLSGEISSPRDRSSSPCRSRKSRETESRDEKESISSSTIMETAAKSVHLCHQAWKQIIYSLTSYLRDKIVSRLLQSIVMTLMIKQRHQLCSKDVVSR